ncbi:MAG: V-type ATP synthase subunit D [Candidatus Promineifilaceae bacterium]|nr:V-type ATP synthase subunit D [Candidatus Promineifilaceae bacterium]
MHNVNVTRMELLEREAQLEIAGQGLELLQQKRTALLQELMRTADDVLAEREALEERAASARRALARAESQAGTAAVRSAALAARGELPLDVQTATVMGVRVPVIEQKRAARSVAGRGYAPLGVSPTIDEAADAFESEVDFLIRLAQSELRLRRLAREIQQTTRRANALEHVVLPRLRRERDYIQMVLEERERAVHFRLKRVKRAREKGEPTG